MGWDFGHRQNWSFDRQEQKVRDIKALREDVFRSKEFPDMVEQKGAEDSLPKCKTGDWLAFEGNEFYIVFGREGALSTSGVGQGVWRKFRIFNRI